MLISQETDLNEKNHLKLHLSLPVVGLVKRASAEGGANQQLVQDYYNNKLRFFFAQYDPLFIDPLHLPFFMADYIHNLGNKTDFILNYQFSYLNNRHNSSINLYSNGLQLGFQFKF